MWCSIHLRKPGSRDATARNLEVGGSGGRESQARNGAVGAACPERRVKAGPAPAGPERAAVVVRAHRNSGRSAQWVFAYRTLQYASAVIKTRRNSSLKLSTVIGGGLQ